MMREGKIKKQYLAIVEGCVKKADVWKDELFRDREMKKTFSGNSGGNNSGQSKWKNAVTRISPLMADRSCSLVFLEIETGRTHQIRAQAASRRHPLLGDRKYGGRVLGGGFLLHAWRLYLPPPFPSVIEAPLSENFKKKLKSFLAWTLSIF
jgi:23S rRNA pseudouridine955/2504/2580 synthase